MRHEIFCFHKAYVLVVELDGEFWFRAKDVAEAINHSNYHNMAQMLGKGQSKPIGIPGLSGRPAIFLRETGLMGFLKILDKELYDELIDLARTKIWPHFAEPKVPAEAPKSPENPYCSKLSSKVPALQVKGNAIFANSQDVAECFGKQPQQRPARHPRTAADPHPAKSRVVVPFDHA